MQKIDKSPGKMLSAKYGAWLNKLPAAVNDENYRYYYDDIAMNLYHCQSGVCAYTERFLCTPDLYDKNNWLKGRPEFPETAKYRRTHAGEMDHFDPVEKKVRYWNWDNLFMIDAKINELKSNKLVINYLKPDLPEYAPEKYLDFDELTNSYYPNTDIEDEKITGEIQYMIDEVLHLNHPVIKHDRYNYIELLKFRKNTGQQLNVDQFFTAVKWALGPDFK